MGRSPCCAEVGLNRGAWTAREDKILRDYIAEHGPGRWRNLPKKAGLKRCGKSCRLRWLNYLRPDIKRGNISPDEEELIIRLHKLLGNRWSLIAGRLPGRTDNEIKNYWNTTLRKKVKDEHRSSANLCFSTDRRQEIMKKAENPFSPKGSKLPLRMGSHVIRTKPAKCSKAFINPQSPKASQFLGANTEARASSSSMPDRDTSMDNKSTESNACLHGPSSLAENVYPSDLTMDFNMGQFSLSDLLNSDFSDFCGFASKSSSKNDNGNESPSIEQPLVFSDEMMQDFCTVSNSASNLNSLASFLGFEEDWLGCYQIKQ